MNVLVEDFVEGLEIPTSFSTWRSFLGTTGAQRIFWVVGVSGFGKLQGFQIFWPAAFFCELMSTVHHLGFFSLF